jgi:hypothetical protein
VGWSGGVESLLIDLVLIYLGSDGRCEMMRESVVGTSKLFYLDDFACCDVGAQDTRDTCRAETVRA